MSSFKITGIGDMMLDAIKLKRGQPPDQPLRDLETAILTSQYSRNGFPIPGGISLARDHLTTLITDWGFGDAAGKDKQDATLAHIIDLLQESRRDIKRRKPLK